MRRTVLIAAGLLLLAPGGLNSAEMRRAAHLCGANPLVRAMDLVEIDPEKDINDVTCLAAASFLLAFSRSARPCGVSSGWLSCSVP